MNKQLNLSYWVALSVGLSVITSSAVLFALFYFVRYLCRKGTKKSRYAAEKKLTKKCHQILCERDEFERAESESQSEFYIKEIILSTTPISSQRIIDEIRGKNRHFPAVWWPMSLMPPGLVQDTYYFEGARINHNTGTESTELLQREKTKVIESDRFRSNVTLWAPSSYIKRDINKHCKRRDCRGFPGINGDVSTKSMNYREDMKKLSIVTDRRITAFSQRVNILHNKAKCCGFLRQLKYYSKGRDSFKDTNATDESNDQSVMASHYLHKINEESPGRLQKHRLVIPEILITEDIPHKRENKSRPLLKRTVNRTTLPEIPKEEPDINLRDYYSGGNSFARSLRDKGCRSVKSSKINPKEQKTVELTSVSKQTENKLRETFQKRKVPKSEPVISLHKRKVPRRKACSIGRMRQQSELIVRIQSTTAIQVKRLKKPGGQESTFKARMKKAMQKARKFKVKNSTTR